MIYLRCWQIVIEKIEGKESMNVDLEDYFWISYGLDPSGNLIMEVKSRHERNSTLSLKQHLRNPTQDRGLCLRDVLQNYLADYIPTAHDNTQFIKCIG